VTAIDPELLDALRLGAYQLLRTRVPAHAAVSSTVDLVRARYASHAAGFVNAVMRRIAEQDESAWVDLIAPEHDSDPITRLALRYAHPRWVAHAFAAALGSAQDELAEALAADDARPETHLAARPGVLGAVELAALTGGEPTRYSPYGVRLPPGTGDPADLVAIRDRMAVVQDEGSQLAALAFTRPEPAGEDRRWLDLCAGPGGKSVMLGALVAALGGRLTAVEVAPHRAELVKRITEGLPVDLLVADGRDSGLPDGGFDRVLVDAPCTGLGALRRRPEARWRRQPSDVAQLARTQRELLGAALRLVRPGGVVGYVTCSPHLTETVGVVGEVSRRTGAVVLDARESFPGVPELGAGPYVQLWPHRHGTDAMFCALLRRSR
jgi:16S rRNA (cytosine967-C5)-methyltransferase